MPIIFEKSAITSMWLKLAYLMMVIIVCGALVVAGWFVDDFFAWIVIGLFLLIGAAVGISTFRDMLIYSRARGKWRVEINSDELIWQSPVQELFQSFRIKLDEIELLQFVLVKSGGTKSRTSKREFFIHLRDGRTMQIPSQEGGVWVNDVFKALKKQGIGYEQQSMRSEKFHPQRKSFVIIPMEDWPT